ncbi:unnamed protein product [Rhizoctonia solani]|uniref:Aminoglycoside phosphotransferase domain-containing protein n=1 Tax=Rhizoctonia solani TaxID=456999 RepID=A0A8H3C098_9AGAM|nr:unnamed protein product [Rhizoctonia solani]
MLKKPLECGRKTIVIKHFEGFPARMKEVKAITERANFEYEALSAIAASGLFDSDSTVQLPRPIDYDRETHTIFMHDLGSPIPLAQVLEKGFPNEEASKSSSITPSNSEEICKLTSKIGRALGDFMGRFHNWSASPEHVALRAYFPQRPKINRMIMSAHHYFITRSADRFKLRENWMDELIAKDQQEDLMDGNVPVMGDCSLQNVLVSPPSEGRDMRIYLLDLEGARMSCPEVDIGRLTASAISFELLYYPSSDRPFIPALHQAYRLHRTLDARRLGILTGMDLIGFGPVLPWAKGQDEEKLKRVVMKGLELLKSSIKEDEELIITNPVMRHLFSPRSR